MNGIFLNPSSYPEWGGVTKKIINQLNAFRNIGCSVSYVDLVNEANNDKTLRVDNQPVNQARKNLSGFFKYFFSFLTPLYKHLSDSEIDFIYFRYRDMNPAILKFLRQAHKNGIPIVTEIPTYPYDGEKRFGLSTIVDRMLRHIAAKYYFRIATYSADKTIWGAKTIQISNGVNIEEIPLRSAPDVNSNRFSMVTVAHVATWHGYDRIINGIKNYYDAGGDKEIHLYIIGGGEARLIQELKELVNTLNLSENIHFEGIKQGAELDPYFNECDLAIGSLGRHRSGIKTLKTLKNVEYASRGIPFIYSEDNPDFDDQPYVMKFPADDTPIDINRCIEFCTNSDIQPIQIRNSALNFDWKIQIDKVIKEIQHTSPCNHDSENHKLV